jgi:hypothetical protein
MIGPKIGTIITNSFSNIRFATAIYFTRGRNVFVFLKPSFLTGGVWQQSFPTSEKKENQDGQRNGSDSYTLKDLTLIKN